MVSEYELPEELFVTVDTGSGIIFKPSENAHNAFLITAYHVFDLPPELGSISVNGNWKVKFTHNTELPIDLSRCAAKCIYVSTEADHDLVIANITNTDALPFKPTVLDVFAGMPDQCVIAGYPSAKELASSQFKSFFCDRCKAIDESRHKYQVNTQETLFTGYKNDIESVKGMSGGGVIAFGADGNPHLAGIIRSSELFGDFAFTAIFGLMGKINEMLGVADTELQAYENQCYYECGIDPNNLDINVVKADIIASENNHLLSGYDADSPIESLERQKKSADKAYNDIVQKKRELSNYYLLLGIHYEEDNKSASSTASFKKAIHLDNKNQHIYNEAYMERRAKSHSKVSNKLFYEKEIRANQTDEASLFEQATDSAKETQIFTLAEFIHFHYTSYVDTKHCYIDNLSVEAKHELRNLCEDYISLDGLDFRLEAQLLLIEVYIQLDRNAQAKEICESFIAKSLTINTLSRDEQFILLKIRYILAIKINQQATRSEWQAFRQYAAQGVKTQLIPSFVDYTLGIVESLYQFENEKGLIGQEELVRLYSPLQAVLFDCNNELDWIKEKVRESHEIKLFTITNGGAMKSKDDLLKENQELRHFNSTYVEENSTLRFQMENLVKTQKATESTPHSVKSRPFWKIIFEPLMQLRASLKF